MRREKDWLNYLHTLSEQGRDLAHYANVYAAQWAHDVRCIRHGIEHRRVGGADQMHHQEWLLAGYVTRRSVTHK